jgi:hypothetical protein
MAAKKTTKQGHVGIEPTRMSLPAMDRPSVQFAWFLDSMIIEYNEGAEALYLYCSLCGTGICEVEHSDTLRVLLNTALSHDCA